MLFILLSAEEKVKDKLAQIAREKLGGLISKEKQLQLERKRKVMAFLNQIKGRFAISFLFLLFKLKLKR